MRCRNAICLDRHSLASRSAYLILRFTRTRRKENFLSPPRQRARGSGTGKLNAHCFPDFSSDQEQSDLLRGNGLYNCLITGKEERRWWPHTKLLIIMSDMYNRKITGYAEHRLSGHWHWTRLPRLVLASPLPTRHHRSAFRPVPVLDANANGVRDLQSAADRPRLAPVQRAPLAIWGVATICHDPRKFTGSQWPST